MGSTRIIADLEGYYEYYPLDTEHERLLPHEHEIVLNTVSGQCTLVDWEHRRFQGECHFVDPELALIKQLLDDWPKMTPYETFVRLLFSDQLASLILQCLREAQESGNHVMIAVALEPLRAILKHCHGSLRLFHLQITAVYQQGYRLIQAKPQDDQQESDQ